MLMAVSIQTLMSKKYEIVLLKISKWLLIRTSRVKLRVSTNQNRQISEIGRQRRWNIKIDKWY